MDKVAQYRKYVQTLLSHYAKDDISDDEVEVQLIFDTERDWQSISALVRSE